MSRRGVAPHVLFNAEGFRGGPVADADGRAYQRLAARPQQLAQRLHTVKQSLAAVLAATMRCSSSENRM